MPQRATIIEKSGKRDVQAYDLSDDHWIGVIEASQANRLKLPCCGVDALPRDPETKIRHFAHPPYTLDDCEAKETGSGHEQIIAEVAAMAAEIGWKVKTEVKYNEVFCDVVCKCSQTGLLIGLEFETGARGVGEINYDERSLKSSELHQVHWFFKKGRRGDLPLVKYSNIFRGSPLETAIKDITETCKVILTNIDKTVQNADEIIRSFKEDEIKFQLYMKDNVPDHVTVFPEGADMPHTIRLGPEKCKIEHPKVNVNESNFKKGERIAREQESLINIIRKNLKNGNALWWDGHPNLLGDSFKRLRDDIEREERHRQFRFKQQAKTKQEKKNPANNKREETEAEQNKRKHRKTNNLVNEDDYSQKRLKYLDAFLQGHLGHDYYPEIIDSPMVELNNISPRQLSINTSQALEKLQIALGYRDPITKAPLKHIPSVTL